MKFNDYQIAQGERSQIKETEFIEEHSLRTAAEELRDKYKTDLDAASDKLDRIKSAIEGVPAVPTLSGLKALIQSIKTIIAEIKETE